MAERKLSANIRLTARYMAEELIAEVHGQRDIQSRLQKRFGCSLKVANTIYLEALAALREADDGDRENRVARMYAQIGRLYRRAWNANPPRLQVCRQLLADLRVMQGLNAPLKVDQTLRDERDEAQRTDAELDYFLKEGHYPDEAPHAGAPQVKPKAASNPLDKLH